MLAETEMREILLTQGKVALVDEEDFIKDHHPCERCRWHGTYEPDKNKSVEMTIGGEQKTLFMEELKDVPVERKDTGDPAPPKKKGSEKRKQKASGGKQNGETTNPKK